MWLGLCRPTAFCAEDLPRPTKSPLSTQQQTDPDARNQLCWPLLEWREETHSLRSALQTGSKRGAALQ